MKKRKIVLIILFILIVVFALINILWYVSKENKYGKYSKGMNKSIMSTFITPKYESVDEEGFTYGVKYPDYLSNVGNLSVAFPPIDDNLINDGLIIWLNGKSEYEYGVILYDNENQYMVYIDENGKELNEEDHGIVEKHKENITLLLNKANVFWKLKEK